MLAVENNSKKSILKPAMVLRYLISFLVIGFLVYKIKTNDLKTSLELSLRGFGFLFILKFFIYAVLAHRWKVILKNFNEEISFSKVFMLNSIGLAVGYILPGAAATDFGKGYFAYKHIKSVKKITVSLFCDRFSGLISILLVLVCGLVMNRDIYQKLGAVLSKSYLIAIGLICICVFAALWLIPKLLRQLKHKAHLLEEISELNSPKLWFSTMALSILCHCSSVVFILCVASMGDLTQVDVGSTFVVFPLSSLTMLIPTTPGSIGVGQVIYKYLYDFISSTTMNDGIVIFTVMQITDIPFILLGVVGILKQK